MFDCYVPKQESPPQRGPDGTPDSGLSVCPRIPGTVLWFKAFKASVPMQAALNWDGISSRMNH